MSDLDIRLKSISNKVQQTVGMKKQLEERFGSLDREIKRLGASLELKQMTKEVLDKLVTLERRSASEELQRLVTRGIVAVWGGDWEFKIEEGMRADISSAKFKLFKDGEEEDILDSHGGGLVQVISFLMRVIFLLRITPKLRKYMFLDEPFSQVSANYQPSVAELVSQLARDLMIKMLMVTHQPVFSEKADRVYQLYDSNGETKAKLIRE